jgi:phospholipid/cholesterol/gamma-HCH transport system substrate-binding protein
LAKGGAELESDEPTDTDAIMASLQVSAGNAEIITQQLAEIMIKINSGNGTLGKLIQDSTIAKNINQTIENLKKSSKGLDENMEAAKDNFLLKGYYNKKARAAKQKKEDAAKAIEDKKDLDEKAK